VHQFLDQPTAHISWLDPQPLLLGLDIPVYFSHGREDVVVPYPQATTLQQWSKSNPQTKLFVTGLYHHTGSISFAALLALVQKIPMEILQSVLMVRAIARTGGL
jgi:fermentation-respiration switch protein FrsA (DUF1100 family)